MSTFKQYFISFLTVALLATGTNSFAQKKIPKVETVSEDVLITAPIDAVPFEMALPVPAIGPLAGPETFSFVSSEMSFGGKQVKNAPYSAEAITEKIQVLGDGNRIVRKTSSKIYRDKEGRTRREQSLGDIGPWAMGEPKTIISIYDPVAKVNYTLEPDKKIARKIPARPHFIKRAKGPMPPPPHLPPGGVDKVMIIEDDGPNGSKKVEIEVNKSTKKISDEFKKESLGKQIVEGVEAEGSRRTMTIPAGKIGNERQIDIVFEHWYSPELQTVVMSKNSDPRLGDVTYKLTNIDRNDPPSYLFEVPSDYKIVEGPTMFPYPPGGGEIRVFRKRIEREE